VPDRGRGQGGRSSAASRACSIWTACPCSKSRATCERKQIPKEGARETYAPRVFFARRINLSGLTNDWRAQPLARKNRPAAQFIQTQYCYDLPSTARVHAHVEEIGAISAKVFSSRRRPLRSRKRAEWMRKHAAGMPCTRQRHRKDSGSLAQARERPQICVELIKQMREMPRRQRLHLMGLRQKNRMGRGRGSIRQYFNGRAPWLSGKRHHPPASPKAPRLMTRDRFNPHDHVRQPGSVIGFDRPFVITETERINPTDGRKILAAKWRRADFSPRRG